MDVLGYNVVLEIQDTIVAYGTHVHNMLELRQADQHAPLSSHIHLGFQARSQSYVDQFHHIALEKGGVCNGQPGFRPEYEKGYYAAFVTDPDGHNLEAVYSSSHL